MIHKVKDVVSKFLHPSFLFSTSGDANRSVSYDKLIIIY